VAQSSQNDDPLLSSNSCTLFTVQTLHLPRHRLRYAKVIGVAREAGCSMTGPCSADYVSNHRSLSLSTTLPSYFHIPWKNHAAVYLVPPWPGEFDPLRIQLQEPHLPVLGMQTRRRRHHLRLPRIWIFRRVQPRGHKVELFFLHRP
jgi:hypothetical protein